MNAIAINPLHAEATNLPVAADALNIDTTAVVPGTDPVITSVIAGSAPTNEAGVTNPRTVVSGGDTADTAPAPKLPQDEQLALDIENIDAQISVLQKRRDGKAQLLANLDKLASIIEGTVLVVTQGRAETTRQVEGVVVAIADGRFKLSVGEGFDATYIVVQAAQIVEVKAA